MPSNTVSAISLTNLSLMLVPVALAVAVLLKWSIGVKNIGYAISRMLVQLLLIGYFLMYIFDSDSFWVVGSVLFTMILFASWIALRTVKQHRKKLYKNAFLSIVAGGGFTLFIVTQGVLHIDPWYCPQYLIPLAGMIFANSMNSVSLAAERLYAELGRDETYNSAREIALKAAMIPIVNALFAVGLVSIPGMMTGQILSGIAPPIAARYQIMVMAMIFSSTVLSLVCFLFLSRRTTRQIL
ncbi:MAG: ABC transporter permease [bacterium]|nr:ABC transporter permease [bacterium]MCP4800460.1 ABC transporter permease [bacterium]